MEADLRFHRAVVRAAHNRYFEMMLEPLTSLVIQQIRLTNSYEVGPALHRRILEEIRKGSAVGARQAARLDVQRIQWRAFPDFRSRMS